MVQVVRGNDDWTEGEVWAEEKQRRREERDAIEPERVKYAIEQLAEIRYAAKYYPVDKVVKFTYRNTIGQLFPFTGWWSVKGIGSGRGIHKLIQKLKEKK